ncbi:DUF3768 domain-containing protein [Sphingomonas mollis]|uniref:DUF3768 domain-containing protein n=1 Tax=Sphingomonas mollis TaxID=2795726 RepID=A0ABS0XUA2_9SPHN|nr:DUF3768 domain-containing protein [Sphingomonas sp. BT553]MBJ6123602.1 DUF3768 domain-containing protein [Sphingomonas sp. BT553]
MVDISKSSRGIGPARSATIARLNDELRQNPTQPGANRIVVSSGVAVLIGDTNLFRGFQRRAELLRAVRDFDTFPAGDDPYGEHDFGALTFAEQRVFWKIDYYDADLAFGSEDPTDPAMTTRVLTIYLASEH